MPSTYQPFFVIFYNDADSSSTPLVGVTVKGYNVTTLTDLGTIGTTGADGSIAGGTLAVAGGTHVRFRVESEGHGRCGYANQITDSGTGQDIVIRPSRGINLVLRPEVLDVAVDAPTVQAAAVILGWRLTTEPASATKEIPGVFPASGKMKIQNYWKTDQSVFIHVNPVNAHAVRKYSFIGDSPFYPFIQNRETNRSTVVQYSTATTTGVTLKVSGFGPYAAFRHVISASDNSTQQVETLTVTVTTVTVGNLVVTVTAAGMSGSPRLVNVALAGGESDGQVATKIKDALNADAITGAFFIFTTSTANVIATAFEGAANDSGMQLVITASHGVGAATSANTTAGVAGFSADRKDEYIALTSGISDKTYQFESIAAAVGTQQRYFKIAHSSGSMNGPWSPYSVVLPVTFAGTGGGTGSGGGGDPTPPDRKPFGELA